MTIAYLGPKGTFTEQALKKFLANGKTNARTREAHSIVDLFDLFQKRACDTFIVPIENSLEGSVNVTIDLLNKTDDVYIQAEIVLPIRHYLMTKTPLTPDKLNTIIAVHSHPQALAQCAEYIRRHMPNAQKHTTASTALAAEYVASLPDTHIATIGNKELATLYGLHLVSEDEVNDQKRNHTRFVVVGRTPTAPTGNDVTSLILSSIKDKPGGLVELLSEFSTRGINLTRIESRPTRHVLGEYLFFIDCEGHEKDPKVADALHAIKEKAAYYKKLGSYARDLNHD